MVSELESYLVKLICLEVSLKILFPLRWALGLMERTSTSVQNIGGGDG